MPRGTTVAGVAVGGLSEDEAAQRLEEELAGRADRAIKVTVGDVYDRGVTRRGRVSPSTTPASAAQAGSPGELEPRVAVGLRDRRRRGATPARRRTTSRSRRISPNSATRSAPNLWRVGSGHGQGKSESPILLSALQLDIDGAREALVARLPRRGRRRRRAPAGRGGSRHRRGRHRAGPQEFADPAVSGPVTLPVRRRRGLPQAEAVRARPAAGARGRRAGPAAAAQGAGPGFSPAWCQ